MTSLLRKRIGEEVVGTLPLAPAELAYLAGGERRVGDALIVGLLASNAATLSTDGSIIEVDAAKFPNSPDFAPFAGLGLAGAMKRRALQSKLGPVLAAIREKLERLGLCPNSSQGDGYRLQVLALFAILIVLGIAKCQVGVERHKPVGILIGLLVVTAIIVLINLAAPRLTRGGKKVLAAQLTQNSRAARAPLDNELMLAVALTGLVVLSGTPYNALYAASKTADGGGGGGGGDGGGDGGGGCGGCGG
jgi:uncharacterized protein (TIGR04222 family)